MTIPNSKDKIIVLKRLSEIHVLLFCTQCKRITIKESSQITDRCLLCKKACKTINHHLTECPTLDGMRKMFLPTWTYVGWTTQQLTDTCSYHYMTFEP